MICGAMAGRPRPVFAVPPAIRAVPNGGARGVRLGPGRTQRVNDWAPAADAGSSPSVGKRYRVALADTSQQPPDSVATTGHRHASGGPEAFVLSPKLGLRAGRYPEQRAGLSTRCCRAIRADDGGFQLYRQPPARTAEHRHQ